MNATINIVLDKARRSPYLTLWFLFLLTMLGIGPYLARLCWLKV